MEPACWELNISVQNGERLSLEQIRAFLEASGEIEFDAANRREVYDWVTGALCEQEYWKQSRGAKGMLRRYIGKMTGLSRAQVTRLINRYKQNGRVSERSYRRNRFASHYTPARGVHFAPRARGERIEDGIRIEGRIVGRLAAHRRGRTGRRRALVPTGRRT